MSRQPFFEAVFFDLCNTLLHFDYRLLPEVEYAGKLLPTTSLTVHRKLREEMGVDVPYLRFLDEFQKSLSTVEEMRGRDHREVSCLQRFTLMCDRLAIGREAARLVVQVHMAEMLRIMYVPEQTRRVLGALKEYPLVLVSNFDDAATVHRALDRFRLRECFEKIFISEEMGWRKPGQEFFAIVVKETGKTPEHCLYVGDDPEADVLGAGRQGFRVAWLRTDPSVELSEETPEWTIRGLSDLLEIVGGNSGAGASSEPATLHQTRGDGPDGTGGS